jgi:hypothetical protein
MFVRQFLNSQSAALYKISLRNAISTAHGLGKPIMQQIILVYCFEQLLQCN